MSARYLDRYETATLAFLASGEAGYTAGRLAKEAGHATSRSQMAIFRTWTLRSLVNGGLIAKMDAKSPAIYVITEAGRERARGFRDERQDAGRGD